MDRIRVRLFLLLCGALCVCVPTVRGHGQDPAPLARIVAAQGTNPVTVTLKVEVGVLFGGSEVDVLTPTGTVKATLVFPPNIDMVLRGDEVKGVTLRLTKPAGITGGLVSEPGRFANHAAALRALPQAAPPAPPPPPAASAASGGTVDACPYSPAELTAAFGVPFDDGKGTTRQISGGTSLHCTYVERQGSRSVILNQLVMAPAQLRASRSEWEKRLAGRLEPIVGDPDDAKWQVAQGDLTGITIHYLRSDRQVEFRLMGPGVTQGAAVAQWRTKVLSIRRLP
jgi:hypothetical protein